VPRWFVRKLSTCTRGKSMTIETICTCKCLHWPRAAASGVEGPKCRAICPMLLRMWCREYAVTTLHWSTQHLLVKDLAPQLLACPLDNVQLLRHARTVLCVPLCQLPPQPQACADVPQPKVHHTDAGMQKGVYRSVNTVNESAVHMRLCSHVFSTAQQGVILIAVKLVSRLWGTC
jgi:hypothetical protein